MCLKLAMAFWKAAPGEGPFLHCCLQLLGAWSAHTRPCFFLQVMSMIPGFSNAIMQPGGQAPAAVAGHRHDFENEIFMPLS